MTLQEKIESAFAHRRMPAEVIEPEQFKQFDSDVEEALWFAGRDWRQITCQDWQQHSSAAIFLSRDAFAYYLPSLLIQTIRNPKEYPDVAVNSILWQLDRSPNVDGWDDHFTNRFLGLRTEEYEAIREWLLFVCENVPHFSYGDAASGPGETFGRAFDTINLLQQETELQKMIDQEDSGADSN